MIKEKTKPNWIAICAFCLAIIALIIAVSGWVKKSISNYNDCIDNIPSDFWFEEELEKKFLTTDLYVLDIDNTGDGGIVVLVKIWIHDQEQYYRCLYKLKSFDSFNWHWELVRYI